MNLESVNEVFKDFSEKYAAKRKAHQEMRFIGPDERAIPMPPIVGTTVPLMVVLNNGQRIAGRAVSVDSKGILLMLVDPTANAHIMKGPQEVKIDTSTIQAMLSDF